jgi:hypothetical protein
MVRIRSGEDVLAVVRDRGLDVKIKKGPRRTMVVLRPSGVDKGLVTSALIGALKAWRLEIIEVLEREEGSA